ncbi:diguanylate cyclase domain-containing protein [Bacillus pinisoli]|uniref:sensor domain-containing diguanylate cyclase n=1 Tax=Bacillus pinisoli TaxID=2901866 RepID=UPI001FF62F99|nr:diguanylate cyclase [Bacillus pinisoli]
MFSTSGREPLAIPDLSQHPLTKNMEMTNLFKSYLGTPLLKKDGEVVGTLCAIDSIPYHYTPKQITLIQTMAEYLSNLIEVDEQIQKKEKAERLLHEQNKILTSIAKGSDIEQILNEICVYVENEIPNTYCSILKYKKEENQLTLVAAPKLPGGYKECLKVVEVGESEGSCGTAAFKKETVIVSDISTNPLWGPKYRDLAIAHNLKSCWSTVILSSKQEVLGTFAIYSLQSHEPTTAELEILNQFSALAEIALEKAETEDKLNFLAYHDELTKLANRLHYRERAEEIIRQAKTNDENVFVMILDLDRFKFINDEYGHLAGDHVLKETANRLVNVISDNGIVARLGGDEFAVIVTQLSRNEVEIMARRIVEALKKPVTYNKNQLEVTASVGLSQLHNDGHTLHELKKSADDAMYVAKEQGKNNYAFFS